jgi:glycosyltransferase involved in cell wall biosynthesis
MKVFFDHQIFTEQTHGGISRYFFELMDEFESHDEKLISSTIFSNNEYLRFSNKRSSIPFFPNTHFKGKIRLMNGVNKCNSERILRNGNYDVFHPTFYDPYFLKSIGGKPFVITVYDLINEKFKDRFDYLKLEEDITNNKYLLMTEASKIIAISESTKKDIVDFYQIDKNKIEVIYLGNSLLKKSDNEAAIFNFEYVLFVGKRSMYKNFLFTIKSVHHLLKKYKLKFVCFGGGRFSMQEIELIQKLELQEYVIHYNKYDDNSLHNLYSNALFFIFPSLYEGFGLPLLEAFSSNCPVLSSDAGSLKEIGGNAAVYFDPINKESLYSRFLEMIESEEIRSNAAMKGHLRLKDFSWEKTFSETINVYNSVLQ